MKITGPKTVRVEERPKRPWLLVRTDAGSPDLDRAYITSRRVSNAGDLQNPNG